MGTLGLRKIICFITHGFGWKNRGNNFEARTASSYSRKGQYGATLVFLLMMLRFDTLGLGSYYYFSTNLSN